ncbi:FliC/FljB family flagellin [Kosakonia cowanii]|uniref:FliC/FljB family flagellin n=1 Tax=Kosakonia cowanii TaxID=208223 RepID=UPI001123C4A5|nr:FliC/FljB family flagellin [Kosakonia cowanii]MDP9768832.1 flagellin [Atlantibacter hermannii]TPD65020.1 FliC/FljB family flagellin [Kosakonia cowanii]TPD89205.1 FliC/FljB family flagellin [Kosakonia cowanii]TPE05647.1 FliC/FljB family flagellin [Kosakonia cowanii]
MSQVINTNALSLVAQNNLNKSQDSLGTAIERLSSGLRINSAKDDAAGQAISNRFTANINGLTQASRNANDGISIAQTTEGALNEINDNLQNIRRLSVQAQNGTNSDSDRQSIQDEIDARLDEINRISEQTEFNGVKVLSKDQKLSIQVGSNDGQTIDIELNQMDSSTLGMSDFTVANGIDKTTLTASSGTVKVDSGFDYDTSNFTDTSSGTAVTSIDDIVVDDSGAVFAKKGSELYAVTEDPTTGEISFDSSVDASGSVTGSTTSVNGENMMKDQAVDMTAITAAGGILLEDGEGNYYVDDGAGNLTEATIDTTTWTATDTGKAVSTTQATTDPLTKIDEALAQVDEMRSGLGAVQNRFASVISNLNNTVNNLSESRSRILDADFASEVSEMSRANILQSAGTTVLAQANQVPQNVLSLLG